MKIKTSNLKILYRFEYHETGLGIWKHNNAEGLKNIPGQKLYNMDMPDNSNHRKNDLEWFSATSTLEKLYYWFTQDEMNHLFEEGFNLLAFYVPPEYINELEHETLFVRDKAEHYKTIVNCKTISSTYNKKN